MAKIDLQIPSLGDKFIDLRDSLSGDAYKWSFERDLSSVNLLVIHHSGSDGQNPKDIADYHINTNNWGGIGYHFLVSSDGLVYYVGDISTARASVSGLDEQIIGIALMGNFVSDKQPNAEQIEATKKLCDFLISYPDLSNIKSWEFVVGHKDLPNQNTNCPGDNWDVWKGKLYGEGGNTQDTINYQKDQIENLQASLASVTGQLLNMQETLGEKEMRINQLTNKLNNKSVQNETVKRQDYTLTLLQALYNLYKFIFLPRRGSTDSIGVE
ncbi:N-acetylmuramoyl-L-alanine amidase [Candidatus Microgenomates bacterium]|nr:N-acetylmuramoyl-L-alanine amidase [Candidatus Microgenomates bacterium]